MLKPRSLALLAATALAVTATAVAQTKAPAYYTPKGYTLTPFLSKTPVRKFKDADYVLKDNVDYRAVVETDAGRMVLDLYEDDTPVTVNSFVWLALHHFYDGIAFHRVIEGFVVQGGDPNTIKGKPDTWGQGGPGYGFGLEIRKKLTFDERGVLGMARSSDPNSNGSQFYITLAPTSSLNGQYTVFGKVVEGDAVLDKIAKGKTDPATGQDAPPAKPTRIKRLYIVQKPVK